MDAFDQQTWAELVRHDGDPAVTVQLPATRETVAGRDWMVKVSTVQARLDAELARRGMDKADREALLAPLSRWVEDRPGVPRSGMTLLATLSPSLSRTFRFDAVLGELAVVTDHFVLSEPLATLLSRPPEWAVLGLSDDGARLVGVRGGRLEALSLPLERTDRQDANRERVQPTPGGDSHRHDLGTFSGGGLQPQGFGTEDPDAIEREVWYREVARGLHDSELRDAPLVLVAKEMHHAGFRSVCRYPGLIGEAIDRSPQDLSDEALSQLAEPLVEALAKPDPEAAATRWANAERDGRALSEPEDIAEAADHGRVDRVFWTPRQLVDDGTAALDLALDDAVRRTGQQGGELVPMAQRHLPGPDDRRINAILRW